MMRILILMALCLAAGAAGGYKFALVREQARLDRNKTLVRRSHTDVWSEHDPAKIAKAARELYASNFVVHFPGADIQMGVDGLIKELTDPQEFPNWSENVQAIASEGDLVFARFLSTTGTQARDLEAVPHHAPRVPNRGKSAQMQEMEVFKIVDGKLAEQWDLSDAWGFYMQLGLFDPDHWTESICGSK